MSELVFVTLHPNSACNMTRLFKLLLPCLPLYHGLHPRTASQSQVDPPLPKLLLQAGYLITTTEVTNRIMYLDLSPACCKHESLTLYLWA